ncbi:MAG: hypothetical protein ACRD1L_08570 [Terriglobales bacterium]
MAASSPPPPSAPPPPTPPYRSNDALLAVVIGVVVVIACVAAFGMFAVRRIAENSHVEVTGSGAQKTVDIHSPLGDIHVNGEGNNAKVDISSPFGSLKVDTTPNIAALDLPIYPGAELVKSREHSPFRHNHGFDDLDSLNNLDTRDGGSPSAQVRLSAAGAALLVDVAEFRTTAAPAQVLSYYNDLLEKYGPVRRRQQDDRTSLEVKLSDSNVRAAAVKAGDDGTHFVLVRVVADGPK